MLLESLNAPEDIYNNIHDVAGIVMIMNLSLYSVSSPKSRYFKL